MSIKLMSKIWEEADAKGTKLLLLLALADRADDEGHCWPGYKYLAGKCRVSETHIIGLMNELVKEGWVVKQHRRDKQGDLTSNDYWLHFPATPAGKEGSLTPVEDGSLTAVEDRSLTPVKDGSLTAVNPIHHYEPSSDTPIEPSHSASEEKSRIVAALQRSTPPLDHSGLNVLDVSKYPEEVKAVIIKVCQLWNLRPPNGKDKAYWIEAGRELLDACGEFGPGLLDKVRADFVSYMEAHQGIPQFTVAGPKSLVNSARAAAGLKRGGQSILPGVDYIDPDEQYNREPSRSRR